MNACLSAGRPAPRHGRVRASRASGSEGRGRLAACRLLGRGRRHDGRVGELVQGPATPAHAGGRKADQVFVAAGEPEMKPALTHDPEQLAALAAAPFLFVQGRLRGRDCVAEATLRVRSVCRADQPCIQAVSAENFAACLLLVREEDEGKRHVRIGLEGVDGMLFLGPNTLEDLPG
jgi:hypothetical protein